MTLVAVEKTLVSQKQWGATWPGRERAFRSWAEEKMEASFKAAATEGAGAGAGKRWQGG